MDVKNLEVACFSTLSAFEAEQSGADRIEFCQNYLSGGLTPDFHEVSILKQKLQIPVFVMIRPREGDFAYSESEFNQMKNEITLLKKLDVDGFVFGILDSKNQINRIQNKQLVELAYPIPCTFHRAFDYCENPIEALKNVIECGFQFILTSGNIGKATEGIDVLKQLVEKAQNRISIIVGGGVRSSNIEFLNQKTNAPWFHSACITDDSFEVNPSEIKAINRHI